MNKKFQIIEYREIYTVFKKTANTANQLTENSRDKLWKQGEDGDNFYIIETGKYSAIINTDEGPKTVMEYDNEGNFGELALLYNMPRAASVKVCNKRYFIQMKN